MGENTEPRLVGFNHVALEVGDIEEALAFYGRLFTSACGARTTPCRSSVLATSSLRKDAGR
jgi:hypothetical protein